VVRNFWKLNDLSVLQILKNPFFMLKNISWQYIMFLFFFFSFSTCSHTRPPEKTITIAVAASAYDAIQAIANAYALETGKKAAIIRGSSGKLATQITQSAPYALFFSADEYYPFFLEKKGFATGVPRIYANGFLSVWIENQPIEGKFVDYLKSKAVKKIALANITSAPYGKAAYKWMQEQNILDLIQQKLVFGESIAQVNTYILSNTVDVAFTSFPSLVMADEKIKNNILQLTIEESPPLPQAMLITTYGQEHFPEESQSFFNFALSKKGQAILNEFGYNNP